MNFRATLSSKARMYLVLSAIMICFALNSIITRYLVQSEFVSPFGLTVVRFFGALLALQLIATFFSKTFKVRRIDRRDILPAILLGIYGASISYGYFFISASSGVLIFYAFVVLTMSSLAIAFEKQRPTPILILSSTLGILGVAVISDWSNGAGKLSGVILMAITGISWAFYSVCGGRYSDSFSYTYNSFLIFNLFNLIAVFFGFSIVGRALFSGFSIYGVCLALFMGMVTTGLSYVLWNESMKKMSSWQGGTVQLVVPVLTAIIAVPVLGEQITLPLVVGGCLILVAIYVNTRKT